MDKNKKVKKSLEEIYAEDIFENLNYMTDECKTDKLGYLEEKLREYANDWARKNAHDWMIDHAP